MIDNSGFDADESSRYILTHAQSTGTSHGRGSAATASTSPSC
ncbi:hypothetical protein [Micromonospora globbae]|nr:hypothetical protein OH732_00430 [Micromonospora globbae]